MNKWLIPSLVLIGLLSCKPSPKPIDYGSDMCHYCKMTIVDRQHAAESVTDKGKVYKYDAIECMIAYLSEHPELKWSFLLVNDYQSPSKLIPASESYYLISHSIPSPMGAFLSAFSTRDAANRVMEYHGGTVYDWSEIQSYIGSPLSGIENHQNK